MPESSALAQDLNRLRDAYRDKLPGDIQHIRSLWEKLLYVKWNSDAFVLFHRLVHNLAGSAGSYGFREVSEHASSLDQLLQQLEDQHNPPGERDRSRITGTLQRLAAILQSAPSLEVLEAGFNLTPDVAPKASTAIRVLMLEDDADHATLVRAHLEHHGCVVRVASSAEEMQRALAEESPDVMMVDIMLPGDATGGIDAVNSARARGDANIPVLFMSARADLEARLAAVRAGGAGYFVKPVDMNEVVRRIEGLKDAADTQYRVLVVDDDDNLAKLHALILRKAGLATRELSSPTQILHVLQEFRPDLILMDLYMPGCPGGELTQVIRQDPRFADLPILFVSGESDPVAQNAALGQGGDAFLVKPVADQQLVDAVANRVKRSRCLSQRLQKLGTQDAQTGLINQNALLARLETTLNELSGADTSAALLFIEINDFRALRNKVKFVSTELVVSNVAATIRNEVGPTEQLARVGAASFVVLLPGVSPATGLAVSDRIRTAIAGRIFQAGVQSITLTVSIGVVPLNDSYQHADDWVSEAALACDIARSSGDNKSYLHNPKTDEQTRHAHHAHCAKLLRASLENNGLRCIYQPIASLCGDPFEKYDVLLRMDDPTGREVLPARFLPVARQEGLIGEIDRWVTQHAVEVLSRRHSDGHNTTFFVKLSEYTLVNTDYVSWLASLLTREQLPASALVFEFTEKDITTRLNEAGAFFNRLRRLGCGICLEHFGSSLDSAQLLKHLCVNYIKVDGAFVNDLESNHANQDTIRQLLNPDGKKDITVIASFVEDATSLSVLFRCGVRLIQGNFLQEPHSLMNFNFGEELG